jgi:3-phenylpropionate/cinnamic acid dioxygenase small subunit
MPVDEREIEKFLYNEARLLDNGKLDEWLSLFTDDAIYWVPANADDINPLVHVSIIYDDRERMQDRVWSIQSGVRWSQDPPSRIRHLISNVEVLEEKEDEVTVSSNFAAFEIRRAIYGARYFVGRYEHRLRREDGSWRVASKKIELLNNDAPIENLTFII